MREIKFRAWHNGKMIQNEKLVFWNGCCYCNESGTLHDPEHPHRPARLKGFSVCNVVQYTGLKDKNGTEIYEGDIVGCNPSEGILGSIDYSDIGIVQYSDDCGAFICLWQPHNERVKSGADNLGSTFPSPLKVVIGNIHENPELLEAKP